MAANTNIQNNYWKLSMLILFFFIRSNLGLRTEPICLSECHCNLTQHDIDCRGSGFSSIPKNIPNDTVSLDLSENPLFVLNDFPELEQLKVLRITNYALNKLKSGCLRSLKALQVFDLKNNLLENIPKDLEAPRLKVLILSGNSLLDFGNVAGPILNSSTLEILDLSHCYLRNIPDTAFTLLPSLRHLNLFDNLLVTLPAKILYPLLALTSLDLSDNGLLQLPNDTFQYNPLLSNLNISYNPWNKRSYPLIHFLLKNNDEHDQSVNDTKNVAILISSSIEILDLSNCELSTLNDKSLASLPNLHQLYILNTKLSNIDPTAFKDLQYLETLHINWNRGVNVNGDIFKYNPKLTTLKCPSCSAVHSPLVSATISNLDLSRQAEMNSPLGHLNPIGLFYGSSHPQSLGLGPEELAHLPALRTIRIRNGGFLFISEKAFTENQNLRTVDLSQGRLRYIPSGIFSSNSNITEIILADNILGIIDGEEPIFTPNAAAHLDLSDNMYRKLRKNYFYGLESLVSLKLSRNPLFGWEEGTFSKLHNLEILDLSQTHLLHLHPDSFVTNYIINTSSEFKSQLLPGDSSAAISNYSFHLLHIQTLRVLDLSKSDILYLPNNTFSGTPSLEKLILSENSLRFLDFNFFSSYLPNLKHLDLSNNPWRCDCKFAQLRDLWMKRKMEPRNHLVICDKPESLHGHSWDSIKDCANMTVDAPSQKSLHQENEATTRETTPITVIHPENSKTIKNSYFTPNSAFQELREATSAYSDNGSHLPNDFIEDSDSNKEYDDSLGSDRVAASESKQRHMNSVPEGIFVGFIGMTVSISLGFIMYYYVVHRRHRNLPEVNDATELDL